MHSPPTKQEAILLEPSLRYQRFTCRFEYVLLLVPRATLIVSTQSRSPFRVLP
jgi:hypothetical protein